MLTGTSARLIGLVTVASVSAGCLLGPNYQRPELTSPQQFRFVEGAQAESLADAPWFSVFEDPALQDLIKTAISNNLDLRAAVARVEEMRARAGIAKSYLYPQIDGGASYRARGATSAEPDETDDEDTFHQNTSYGFQLGWELDLFGKLRRQNEAALAIALASEQARRGVMVTLVGDVASSYFLLRELVIQLVSARQSRTGWRSIASARCARGRPPRFPNSSNRSRRSRTRSRCSSADRRVRSRAGLLLLMRRCHHRFPQAFLRPCWSAGRMSPKPSSSWWRRTPTSASPRRCSIQRSA